MSDEIVQKLQDEWMRLEAEKAACTEESVREQFNSEQSEIEKELIDLSSEKLRDGLTTSDSDFIQERSDNASNLSITIVGAGIGGLCLGAMLKQHGFDDFIILEKSNDIGGTWLYNTYPGVACDVASYFYSFTFLKNPNWSQMFAPGREIKKYLEDLVAIFKLDDHIYYNNEVESCTYRKDKWCVKNTAGKIYESDVLVPATGFLHVPHKPEFNGLSEFAGKVMHSAEWDESESFSGKRVGIIGNGSSAVQIISNIVDDVEKLNVFQRTPQWIFPAKNDFYSEQRREMLSLYPDMTRKLFEFFMGWYNGGFGNAVVGDKDAQKMFDDACQANLQSIKSDELRKRLTPDYPVLCKRLVFSSTFYPALERSNCELLTGGIERFSREGIVTSDGEEIKLDIVIMATGFDTHVYCKNLNISVEDGPTLKNHWSDGLATFESIGVSGFPNLFMINGPFSTVGNLSTMTCSEMQCGYILSLLREIDRRKARAAYPKKEAESQFVVEMNEAVKNTVWVTGCNSWYLNEHGGVDVWTKTPEDFMQLMRRGPRMSDYEFL